MKNSRTSSKHDSIVDAIRRHPQTIGIEDHLASTGEAIFWEGESYVTSPDSLIFTRDKVLVLEYKSSDYDNLRARAQLERHMDHVGRLFNNFEVTGLYVHGRRLNHLNIEEI